MLQNNNLVMPKWRIKTNDIQNSKDWQNCLETWITLCFKPEFLGNPSFEQSQFPGLTEHCVHYTHIFET